MSITTLHFLTKRSWKRTMNIAKDTNSFKKQSESVVLMEGKVSKKGRVFKTWRDRHLVLYSNGDLCYYKSENKSVRKGYLKLSHHADVQKAKRSGKFYFIVFGEERNLFVKTSSKEDREKWYSVIRQLIVKFKEKTLSISGQTFAKNIDLYYKPCESNMTWNDAVIGSGTYGVVWRARSRQTNQLYAIKSIAIVDRKRNKKKLKKEIDLLRLFNHPNIVKF
eukprot:g6862.t1